MIAESENLITSGREKRFAACIAAHLFFFKMLSAIDLHDQVGCVANEVCNIGTDRRLPPEARAFQTIGTQCLPDKFLCVGRIAAKHPRSRAQFF